jgi:hypothetical protein
MFTLTWEPPFEEDIAMFPAARNPAYIGRLAVSPEWLAQGSIVSMKCLRKAIELARHAGADAIRSEANPDLARIRTLLDLLGFREYGSARSEDGRGRVYLQRSLDGEPTPL